MTTRCLPALLIAILLRASAFAQTAPPAAAPAAVKYEIPALSAATVTSGGHSFSAGKNGFDANGNFTGSYTMTTASHSLSVAGKVHFFNPPGGYLIVCYFVKKANSAKGDDYSVITTRQMTGWGSDMAFSFDSGPIVSENLSTISVQGSTTDSRSGGSFAGWIVSVETGGQVLRTISDRPELQSYVQAHPEAFPMPPAGRAAPDSQFYKMAPKRLPGPNTSGLPSTISGAPGGRRLPPPPIGGVLPPIATPPPMALPKPENAPARQTSPPP